MKLSRDEETFLRHWIYDEAHYAEGPGPAKRLQVQHGAIPAELAELIAAAFPDLAEQEAAGDGPPPAEAPTWPWSIETFRQRLAAARAALAHRRHGTRSCPATRASRGTGTGQGCWPRRPGAVSAMSTKPTP